MLKNKCANRGKKCQWPELEDSIGKWIEQQHYHNIIRDKWNIRGANDTSDNDYGHLKQG